MHSVSLLDSGHIDFWILVLGLFLPRLSLFLAAFWGGDYPPNPLPVLINFLGWLFLPRFLIAYYIYLDAGPNNLWFWAYLILGVVGLIGETGYARGRIIRRTTTVNPDGSRTIVEEEED
ncbi:MAG: hypothetical protein LV479_04885 [Methylacidiphilales bacterium]|nr:hypothetical protein [Candidatus Methylacidiphilales bacterium]